MKIGIITDFLDIAPSSGIGNVVYYLVRNLLELDRKNEYTLIHVSKLNHEIYGAHNVREITVPPFPVPPRYFARKNITLPLKLRIRNFDIIHETSQSYPVPPLFKSCSIITVHDVIPLVFPNLQNKFDRFYFSHFLDRVLKKTDKIITDSLHSRSDICKYCRLPEEKISVIYPGLSEKFRPMDKEWAREHLRINFPFIFNVGGFNPRKNLINLVAAFYIVKKRGVKQKLVIEGLKSKAPKRLLEKIETLGLQKEVIFVSIPQRDLPMWYNVADLFVYPSLYEGFGLPLLEAMGCGTPVITSNVSSMPEVVGDCALMIDPYNVDELASAIVKMLNNNVMKNSMIKTALDRAKLFSWKKAAIETLEVYEETYNIKRKK